MTASTEHRLYRVLVWTAAAAGSAVLLLLAAGMLMRANAGPSLAALPRLLIAAVLLLPVYRVYRRKLWQVKNLRRWAVAEYRVISGAAVLAALSTVEISHGAGPVGGLLTLPMRVGAGAVSAAALAYRGVVGQDGAAALFEVGRWTLQLVWVYLLADIGSDAVSGVRTRRG
ncbi:MAG: hypothetical protein SVU88_04885 [Candidatus Nanohaloarchaea archaeon]|nr:hypothetical protein [Candidatus Nanohaloarchaea archaeon]